MKDVIVIGAGIAGITCAQQLKQAGLDITIVEKSAGVGGRMATRRLQGTWVDHGAQLISVKSDSFGRFVRKLQDKGIVQEWTRDVYQLSASGLIAPEADARHTRYCCPMGMTAIAKYLAHEIPIINNARIVSVSHKDDKWQLVTDRQELLETAAIVSTIPAPQFLPIFEEVLAAAPNFLHAVQSVTFAPSVTIMAGYNANNSVPSEWQAIRCINDPILDWISYDSSKHSDKAVQPVFVLQSTADFAKQSMEEPDLEIAGKPLLNQVGRLLAKWLASPEWWQVHRWRYAIAEESLGVSCLSTEIPLPLICAGDWCAGKNIEAAYHSGLAAAESAIELLKA
ncbi:MULTISPECIES: NAD(P)/FAD-dependent oxidoreductase [Pseudanabaena]|uniref:Amine oxidase n=2 Tax=Pseudanabaena TaxID=1152 RepID=L8MS34_9CYAN|nr:MULTISPECIES: FAD-dependent oxidoreductase [Pseudanabaena]ELS30712.1 amine oxidase [Pseudanabaena biceps PCC 7429]MDG3497014.1 FAD-dependent oxidoreductase [Pseudanabaena catenata USMAC16]